MSSNNNTQCSRLKKAAVENKKCCTFKQSRFEKSYSLAFAIQNSQISTFSKNKFQYQ